jgi:hydrogenase maturation protease
MSAQKHKILVVGVGNVLHGDDGFGVEVAHRLMAQANVTDRVMLMETGIGGMSLVQELMYGYEALLIIDAYSNGGNPGKLYLLEPILPDTSNMNPHELRDYFADTHYATPLRALNLLDYVGELPKTIRIIGCEPEEMQDLRIGLSHAVAAAVSPAVNMAVTWIDDYLSSSTTTIQ